MKEQDQGPAKAREIYGDLIDRGHHVSSRHPQMPRMNRAVQFAPYATLKGYDDLVREAARETDPLRRLDESEIEELNARLTLLLGQAEPPEASFTVFVPDGKKAGGRYAVLRGRPVRYDEYERSITLDSGEVIPVEYIAGIDGGAP